jgi:hypothetical protein
MKDGYLAAGSDDRREGAVGITENQNAIRPMLFEQLIALCKYLSYLVTER